MSKITIANVADLTQTTTAATTINNNFSLIQTAFDNTLSRDGTAPNQLMNTLDMNSNQIINLPTPITLNSPVRLQDLQVAIGSGTVTAVPAGGLTNQVLSKTSNTDYAIAWAYPATAAPTTVLGLTAIPGSATTLMRSDAAPALDQTIAPTWTGLHTFVGVTNASRSAVNVHNTSYVTNLNRFGNPMVALSGDHSQNVFVGTVNNDAPTNTAAFPVPVVGSGVIQNNGNTTWGGYFESHQFGTGVGNGIEIDCFNYGGAPSAILPPSRGIGAPALPIGLTIVAAGQSGFAGQTYHNGAIGIQIPLQTAGIQWLTGIYMDPGSIATTGVYVDASNTLGAPTAARFDIQGTGSDTALFLGVHGVTGTTNVMRINFGGTDRFVIDSSGNINTGSWAATTIPVNHGGTGDTGTAWTVYTPALSTTIGSLTTASATGRWKSIGKTVFFEATISITTNGTGAGVLQFTLPTNSFATNTFVGRDIAVGGNTLSGSVGAGVNLVNCQTYNNTYPAANGSSIVYSGTYEST